MMLNDSDNADWHTSLMRCLDKGIRLTNSDESKTAMESLRQHFAENDECAHEITVTTELPSNVSIDLLRQALNCEHHVPTRVEFMANTNIVRVITSFRSSKTYAEESALWNLQTALDRCFASPDKEWSISSQST